MPEALPLSRGVWTGSSGSLREEVHQTPTPSRSRYVRARVGGSGAGRLSRLPSTWPVSRSRAPGGASLVVVVVVVVEEDDRRAGVQLRHRRTRRPTYPATSDTFASAAGSPAAAELGFSPRPKGPHWDATTTQKGVRWAGLPKGGIPGGSPPDGAHTQEPLIPMDDGGDGDDHVPDESDEDGDAGAPGAGAGAPLPIVAA